MHRNSILQSLPLLASVLGRRYGVTIRIGGTEAYTDGNVIQLPALPMQYDDTFTGLVRGYADHEAAHIRYTDFTVCKHTRSPLERHIWNIFEDWRVENAMVAIYPGCRGNFRWLIRHCFLEEHSPDHADTVTVILDWLLLMVRSWDEPALSDRSDRLALQMDLRWPWLRLHLESILHTMHEHCPDSAVCLDYARQVIEVLKTASCTHAQKQEKLMNSCGKPTSPPEENAAKSDSSSQSDLRTKPAITAENHQGASKDVPSSLGPEEDEACPPWSSQQQDADALQVLMDMPEESLPADMGTLIGKALTSPEHITPAQPTMEVARIGHKYVTALDPTAQREAKQATNGMRARFHGLLQATHLKRSGNARRGRLNTRSLHKITVQDPRVFLQRIQRPGIDTAVHILLDCSGSMRKRIALACQASFAVAKALEQTGINVGVTAFPAEFRDETAWNSLKPIVQHGQKVHAHFSVASGGQTPLGPALWWVLQEMLPLKENRKLILIMTDGEPDCTVAASSAIQAAIRNDMEIYGVGIMSNAIQSLLPLSSMTIWNLPELAPAMFALLQQALVPSRS